MAAWYALSSLMVTIKLEFLKPNPRVSLDDENALDSLVEKLSSLQDFLSEKSSGAWGGAIRGLEIQIRDFALRAEDGIEIKLSEVLLAKYGNREYKQKARGELHQTLGEAAREAEEILKIINKTSDEPDADEAASDDIISSIHHQRIKLANNMHRPNHNNNVGSAAGSSRFSPQLEEIIMVGDEHIRFFDSTKHLLLSYGGQVEISIVGMAGIGKSALARKVYRDPLVASNFDILAWATVSHEYNLQEVLCDLLHSMTPTIKFDDKGGSTTLPQLREKLYTHLKDNKYFIVLDDIWDSQSYYDIRQSFPDDQCGSFILLTTQFENVAIDVNNDACYAMELLCERDSWDLFCNKLSLKGLMAPKFVEIAKHVVQQCDGLPQSIVAVAERLSKCNHTLEEWKKVQKEIDSLGTLYCDPYLTSKLTLTYNKLPQNVKVCFLYLAVFPKGSAIQVRKLLSLWIAEGFVEPFENRASEDIAHEYLEMLDSNGLLFYRSSESEFKTCRMHYALHSFCTREAQKEGLFCAAKNLPQCSGWLLNVLANSCRWLSLRPHNLDYYVLFSSNNLRSIFFCHGDPVMFLPFKLLRILDFSQSPFLKRVPLQLKELVFLRYLSIPQWFEGLDYIVSNNKNLQVLIFSDVESKLEAPTTHLPSRIWESPRINHLELGNLYTIDPPSMVNDHLESLFWASPNHFKRKVYSRFPNLKTLKVFCNDVFEPSRTHRGSCRSPSFTLANMRYLSRLENLKVVVPSGSITSIKWFVFPVQLKKLSLSGTNLSVNALGVISQLPQLMTLELINDFCDKVWEVDRGFPKLKYLHLEVRNLEQWVAHANNFPKLFNLVLKCDCLEEIPCGFVELPRLRKIELEGCPPSVVASAKWIQKELLRKKDQLIVLLVGGKYWYPCWEKYSDASSQYTNMEEPAEKDLAALTLS